MASGRLRREPDSSYEADAAVRPPPSEAPDALLVQLQRSAGNQAVARLLEREGTLHVPGTWLDQETHSGPGRAKLRDLNTTQPQTLVDGLAQSLPLPGLVNIEERSPDEVRSRLLFDMKEPVGRGEERVEGRFLHQAKQVLGSHVDLLELSADIDPADPPKPRKIMRPLDLMPEPSDLAGASEDVLKGRWCVLISLVKTEGQQAIRAFLQDKVATEGFPSNRVPSGNKNLDYYRALHHYFYEVKHVEYDDTSAKMAVMRPFGYSLKFVGPTSFDNLWRANLRAGRYIVDIARPGHTMLMTVGADFTQPLAPGAQLSDILEFDNDGTNYNQPLNVTLAAHVLNVWEK